MSNKKKKHRFDIKQYMTDDDIRKNVANALAGNPLRYIHLGSQKDSRLKPIQIQVSGINERS